MAGTLIEAMRESPQETNENILFKGQGGLASTSKQGLAQKSKALGLPTTPTTPVSAYQAGANPDQAKMAGTPNQLNAAIKLAVAPNAQNDLQTSQRLNEPRQESTGEEAARAATASAMENLGSIGNRVNEAVATKLNTLYQTNVAPTVNTEALPAAADIKTELETLIDEAASQQQKDAALVAINNKMGNQTVDDGWLSEDDILQYYSQTDTSAIGTKLKEALGGAVTLADIMGQTPEDAVQALGMSRTDLSQLLGVAEESLNELTIQEFQQLVQDQIGNMTGEIESIQYLLADPSVSPQEKRELRSRLRDLGATGQRSTEEELKELSDLIDAGDEITFQGKKITLEELLSDEYMTGVIASYLQAPEGSSLITDLEDKEPELATWIEEQRGALEEAMKNIKADIQQFSDVQAQKAELRNTDVGPLDDEIMKGLLGEGWNNIGANSSSIPAVLAQAKTNPLVVKELIRAKDLGDSKVFEQLAGLTAEQLDVLGVGKKGGSWDNWMNSKELVRKIEGKSIDQALSTIFGEGTTEKGLDAEISFLKSLGVSTKGSPLDKDGDGRLDNLSELKKNIKSLNQAGLDINQLVKSSTIEPRAELKSASDIWGMAGNSRLEKLKGLMSDGKLDAKETNKLLTTLSKEELDAFSRSRNPYMTRDNNIAINNKLREYGEERKNEHLNYWMVTNNPKAEWLQAKGINNYKDLEAYATVLILTPYNEDNKQAAEALQWLTSKENSYLPDDTSYDKGAIRTASKQLRSLAGKLAQRKPVAIT